MFQGLKRRFGNFLRKAVDLERPSFNQVLKAYWLAEETVHQEASGLVTWDASPPRGVGFQTHQHTFADSLQMGAGLCFFRLLRECPGRDQTLVWVAAGHHATAIVSTLPGFQSSDEGRCSSDLSYLGHLGIKLVFADPRLSPVQFRVGNDCFFVEGWIRNHASAVTPPERS